jgi:RsiW-degrading membrane proteinase PrsW (M82 family)
MSAAAAVRPRTTSLSQLAILAGAGLAVAATLWEIDFFLRPGLGEVLKGLAHHAFVLALLLILTSRSRTVSLPMLGIFWLLGVWAVYSLAYFLEEPMASRYGAGSVDEFVPIWWAPFAEETAKLLPVALFLLLAGRRGGRQPGMSDGLLLGFMVGAGVSFVEDAHAREVFVSGSGWTADTPWTAIFPTISPIGSGVFALNHAIWASLSGLTIGAALMLRQWRWTWPIALAGPLLAVSNHATGNSLTGLAGLFARGNVSEPFATIRDVTDGGRLPLLVLVVGAVAVAAGDWLILRWVSKRDRMFPALSFAEFARLVRQGNSRAGFARLVAAERYVRLRRSMYFAGWRMKMAGANPEVSPAQFDELTGLLARARTAPAGHGSERSLLPEVGTGA